MKHTLRNVYKKSGKGFTSDAGQALEPAAAVAASPGSKTAWSLRMQGGFTLIELLIVIAIIGILASIVLASLDESREKGRNSARNSSVEEYVKGLELMRTNVGSYVGNSAAFQCLGDYDDDMCWTGGTGYSENAALQTALAPYMQLGPQDMVNNFEGFVYRPCPATAAGCSASYDGEAYEIRWFLEGANRACVAGQAPVNANYNNLGITYCRYIHQ